ncbi:hypothetical protein DFJ74DRAFT_256607 [Hyaloraphidium curvatum]|nr:hypothetical protein DFJ74DRAFT_256607 [Hyaloraphidium curvatum]
MTRTNPRIPLLKPVDSSGIARALQSDGVAVLDGLYDQSFVAQARAEFLDYHGRLAAFVDRKLPPETGPHLYGNISIRVPGRWEHLFDILPSTRPKLLSDYANFCPPALLAAVDAILGTSPSDPPAVELGGIPSLPFAQAGAWHRDSFPLFDERTDATVPPWYLTMVIPLCEDGDDAADFGTTSFVLGSHRKTMDEIGPGKGSPEGAKADLKPGQAVLFDGRTVHRGEANRSAKMRPFLYMTFTRRWYVDREEGYLPRIYDDDVFKEGLDGPNAAC